LGNYVSPILKGKDDAFAREVGAWFTDPTLSADQKKSLAKGFERARKLSELPDAAAKEVLRLMAGDQYFGSSYAEPILKGKDASFARDVGAWFNDPTLGADQKKSLAKGFKYAGKLSELPDAAAKEVLRVMAGEQDFDWHYVSPILEGKDASFAREVGAWFTDRTLSADQKKSLAKGFKYAGKLSELPDAAAKEVLRLMAGDQYLGDYASSILKGKDATFAQEVGDSLLGSQLNLAQKKSLLGGMRRAGHLGSLSAKAARAALDISDGNLAGALIATHPDAVAGYLENPNLRPEVREKVEAAVKSKKWTFQREAKNAREAGQPDLNREAALSLIDRLNHCGEQLAK
jgi:hypothetical protein